MSPRTRMMIGWSVVAAAVTALFWTIWYLTVGSVPVLTAIKFESVNISLLLGVSRWWDCLFIIPLVVLFVAKVSAKKTEHKNLVFNILNEGMDASLTVGLFATVVIGFFYGLVIGLFIGVHITLILFCISLAASMAVGIIFAAIVAILLTIKSLKENKIIEKWLLGQ